MNEQPDPALELRASEARLRLALDAGRMAVWEYDISSDSIVGSPELNRLLGYHDDAVLDVEEVAQRYYPGERERIRSIGTEALARGERFFEAEYRFYRPDGVLRWYLLRAEVELSSEGTPLRTVGVVLDITERKEAEEALAEREAELNAALKAGSLAIVDFDHVTGIFRPSARLNELYGYPADHELTLDDVRARYHPNEITEIHDQRQQHAVDSALSSFDWTLHLLLPTGEERWVEGLGEYIRDTDGRIIRSRGVVLDISERTRSEIHQRLLIEELNHRVKNTLAIVQSLAHQTLRGEVSTRVRMAFEGRLHALAEAHDLLTQKNWAGATLEEVVDIALRLRTSRERITIAGPFINLEPKTAVTISMALHELATNATKYGALSTEGGRISVCWESTRGKEPRLKIRWQEEGGPEVAPPGTRGFGSRMIERALASELSGTVHLDFRKSGVVCEIDAPLPAATTKSGYLSPSR